MRLMKNVTTGVVMCLLELSTNIRRTLITTLGIFFGVTSLLVNLAFVRAIKDDVRNNMIQAGSLDIITISPLEPDSDEQRLLFKRSPGLSFQELETIIEDIPEVKQVLRASRRRWRRISISTKSKWSPSKAITNAHFDAFRYEIALGRPFNRQEEDRGLPVAIIGPELAEELFGSPEGALGKSVTYPGGHRFEVIGITEAPLHSDRVNELFFPFQYFQKYIRPDGYKFREIQLHLAEPGAVRAVEAKLKELLIRSHRGVEDFEIEASLDKVKEMEVASKGLEVLLFVIAGITLLIGGVSIMNIMFATIGNRIREIGVRKAMGARRGDIFLQFVIEAVVVSLVGSIPGILLGSGITMAPPGMFPFEPRLTLFDYLLAISFTIGIGLVSGLFPAFKAGKMEVVEALQQ